VLVELHRDDASDMNGIVRRALKDGCFGLVAAAEATAALSRARSVLPVFHVMRAALLRGSDDAATLQAIKMQLPGIVVLVPEWRKYGRGTDAEAAIEEIEEKLAAMDGDYFGPGMVGARLVAMLYHSPDAGIVDMNECLHATSTGAQVLGELLDHDLPAFDAFIDALRAIPAA
jgi:hypothetical protein